MDLSNPNQRKLLDELSARKAMLPDIKRVRIQYMNNDLDASVRDFLDNCLPDSLQSFTINHGANTRIKASFYLPSIQTAFKKTTEENYICCFDCSKKEFEKIVKASHNTDRLVMYRLKMNSEQEFDF
jgi:DNA-directed RNA polymerase subunit H (RpoH/RPB5)